MKRVKRKSYYGRPIYTNALSKSGTIADPLCPPPFLEIGGLQLSYPLLSQKQVKLRTSNLAGAFTGPIRIKVH